MEAVLVLGEWNLTALYWFSLLNMYLSFWVQHSDLRERELPSIILNPRGPLS